VSPTTVRRLAWHPVTIAGCLAGLASGLAMGGGTAYAWFGLGLCAGFAVSGSV